LNGPGVPELGYWVPWFGPRTLVPFNSVSALCRLQILKSPKRPINFVFQFAPLRFDAKTFCRIRIIGHSILQLSLGFRHVGIWPERRVVTSAVRVSVLGTAPVA